MTTAVPEQIYYARHLRLPGFTAEIQEKLRQARVLVVGVGGLGCPAATYLAGAGVGTIALCDSDEVSATNLHRQMLFDSDCIGQKKVGAAARRLRSTNPNIRVEEIDQVADVNMLRELVPKYDLLVDGTDNFAAKFDMNDACERAHVPLVYGSIFQFEGQVSVFHLPTDEHPSGISYRDLYPDSPPAGLAQNCGEAGVLGVLPGIIGSLQANEAIKVITGLGQALSGYLLMFDALTASSRRLKLTHRRRTFHSTDVSTLDDQPTAVEMTDTELNARLVSGDPPFLIDVREANEHLLTSLGGENIPLTTLPTRINQLPRDRDIVVYCKSGVRSAQAALYLRSVLTGTAVFSLRGGSDGACNLQRRS